MSHTVVKPHIWRVRVDSVAMWVCGYRLPLNGRHPSLGLGATPDAAYWSFMRGLTMPIRAVRLSIGEFFKRWAP